MGLPTDPRDERVTPAPAQPGPECCIRLSIEAKPRVYFDCETAGSQKRLLDWLQNNSELRELVGLALELSREHAT